MSKVEKQEFVLDEILVIIVVRLVRSGALDYLQKLTMCLFSGLQFSKSFPKTKFGFNL